ncbi:carbon-nitrogen hydrolase [Thiomicrorhabdus immobilis]|uniref:Carbon-nitrogen hydrolase n=1 Tax=Thiomicrorhabdus immobilis TaxID=2791037 RepID=A0ABM7MC04_9GAMM|nr:nitrilase-related carbon-nitrogen hydrolase [Thiomicrorhabdus immobilis]BCN92910.1 carbon-nitrogen hydrolase [Thiomicrorhabdus immobilis]
MGLKLGIIQFDAVWQNTPVNLQHLKNSLVKQDWSTMDVLLLPEIFHAGFAMQPQLFAESIDGLVSQCLADLAMEYSVTIVAGVAQRRVRADCTGQQLSFFNNALVFDKSGEQTASYTKQTLFSYANEQQVYQAGHKSKIVEINGQPFGLFICYDLRFPELFRKIAKQVKGMIVLANWPESRQNHWESLLKARAIENQCFVIGVNRIGQDGNGLIYAGGSCVISPLGEVLAYADAEQTWLTGEIELQQVDEVREQFPFLEDMYVL